MARERIFTVGPGEVGMRLRFGRILASDLQPGLHFRWPWPFESDRVVAQTLVATARVRTSTGTVAGGGDARAASQGGSASDRTQRRRRRAAKSGSEGDDAGRLHPAHRRRQPHRPEVARPSTGSTTRSTFAYNLAEPEALVRSTILAAFRGAVATRASSRLHHSARGDRARDARGRPDDAGPLRGRNRGAFRSACFTTTRQTRSTTPSETSPARRRTSCVRSTWRTSSR